MVRSRMAFAAMLVALPVAAITPWQAAAQATAPPAQAPAAQDDKDDMWTGQQGVTLHVEVRRVPIDVVVTDKNGNPVRGLKKEDFIVKEDDTPQTLLSFDYLDGSVPSFVPPQLPELPTNTWVNLPREPERGPLYVLYYDMVNTFPEDQVTFRRELLNFVDRAKPGTRIALFVNGSGLHLIQGFTSDHAVLRAAITSKGPGPHVPEVFLYGENFGRQDMGAAISNLQFLAEYLGGIAGRKNLIWLADKFPVSYGPVFRPVSGDQAMNGVASVVRNAFAAMMRSQVAIYPVDVKGVVVYGERSPSPAGDSAPDVASASNPSELDPTASSNKPGQGGDGTTPVDTTSMEGQSLGLSGYSVTSIDQFQEDYIATSTGGHAYYSNNRIEEAMEKALEQGESYYTLSYSPTNKDYDGSDRHVEVSLANKSGYKLSYRSLYYAVSDDALQATSHAPDELQARFLAAKAEDTLYANIEHGAPMLHDLVFSAHVAAAGAPAMATAQQMEGLIDSPVYFRSRRKDRPAKPLAPVKLQKYVIDYGIFDPRLKALAAGGAMPPTLEFAAAAYDADGRLLNSMLNEGRAAIRSDGNEKAKALFHASQELDTPLGAAWIRIAVRDKLDNRTGTLEVRLPLKPETVSASLQKAN